MTFAVPADLHRELRRHREIRWAEVARRAFVKEINRLHIYDKVLKGSLLTEEDAIQLGRKIRRKSSRKSR